jgi:hypothetical protein
MKCAPFEYVRPASVDDAVKTLADADGEGKLLAGGQSLVPVLALRMARPSVLVDVNRIPGLAGIRPDGHGADAEVRVGALTRHAALTLQTHHPLLAEAARWIGHTAIRSGRSAAVRRHAAVGSPSSSPTAGFGLDEHRRVVPGSGRLVVRAGLAPVGAGNEGERAVAGVGGVEQDHRGHHLAGRVRAEEPGEERVVGVPDVLRPDVRALEAALRRQRADLGHPEELGGGPGEPRVGPPGRQPRVEVSDRAQVAHRWRVGVGLPVHGRGRIAGHRLDPVAAEADGRRRGSLGEGDGPAERGLDAGTQLVDLDGGEGGVADDEPVTCMKSRCQHWGPLGARHVLQSTGKSDISATPGTRRAALHPGHRAPARHRGAALHGDVFSAPRSTAAARRRSTGRGRRGQRRRATGAARWPATTESTSHLRVRLRTVHRNAGASTFPGYVT